MRGLFGSTWTAGVCAWILALGGLVAACGSSDGRKQARPCPEDCPAEQCEEETGECLAPLEPSGGRPNEPEPASGGTPNEPSGGTPNEPGGGTPNEPSGGTPNEPSGGTPNEPSGGAPNEPEPVDPAPTVTLISPANSAVVGSTVTFLFEVDEPSTFTCTLNDEPVDDCEPGITLVDLLSGEHTFTVMATDEAGNQSQLVEVTFIVNRGPTIGDIDDIVFPEDTSFGPIAFTVGDPDSPLEDLVVTAELSSGQPIPPSGLALGGSGETRSVTLTPAANAFGAATLTLSVSDGFVTATRVVPVTVTPVNDPPSIENIPNQGVAEHAVLGPIDFRVSDLETPADDLVVTAQSSDTTKVPLANIALGGSGEQREITITPVAQQSGPVTITLTVSDGELTASDSFVVTLGSTDDPPTLSAIADQTTPEDTPRTVAFTVGDPDTDVNALTPSADFDSNGIVQSVTFGGSGANRTFTVTPKPNQTGTAQVTITISDATSSASRSFTLTVTPVNDAPTVTAPPNQTIDEDSSTGALPFTVADVDSATVTVTATSSNTTLIPNANINVAPASGPPGSRNVTVTPVANGSGGPVTITLTASDGSLTGTGTFTVTVTPVNDPPSISNITDRTVEPDTSTGSIAFTVSDPDGDTPLVVTATSSDQRVVPNANISLGGSGGSRNISVLPGTNQGGTATITVTVDDGNGGTASDTFVLSAKVLIAGAVAGNGSVVASGTGCSAGATSCTALPGAGNVTFVATPGSGSRFVEWSGACAGSGNGVVTPIPNAGVTCTAHFQNLWARLFHAMDLASGGPAVTNARGVVETSKALHYLGTYPNRSTTSLVWKADPLTGAVAPDSAFMLTQDGVDLVPTSLTQNPADEAGTVALVESPSGPSLIWLDDGNRVVRAASYPPDQGIVATPYGLVHNADGLAFTQSIQNPQLPTVSIAQLVRVDPAGNVRGATAFREENGACARPVAAATYVAYALAVNADGSYLVAGHVPPLDGTGLRMNLTLIDSSGVPVWGRHVEAGDRAVALAPVGVTANGDEFLVTGIMAVGTIDGFALSIRKDGTVNWWRSFGAPGAVEFAARSVASGRNWVVTGYAASGTSELFALHLEADGSLATGLLYGGDGTDQGAYLAPAALGGFNLFGSSTNSFGNTLASSWALRVDADLQVNLQVGSVTPYEPALSVQPTANISATCVGTYSTLEPKPSELNVDASQPGEITIMGAYQATP